MKKLMIAAAAAFCGTVFGLESANVVGYATRAGAALDKGKFTMVTPNFCDVGSDTIKIATICTPVNVEACSYDDVDTDGAEIQVWNGAAYDLYYFINDAFDDVNENLTGWAKDGEIVSDAVAPGTGFWFRYAKADGANLTTSGEVPDAASIAKDVYNNKFNMTGNPYPTLLNLSKVQVEGITPCGYDDVDSEGLELQVWNGAAYDMYYYINDAFDDVDENLTGWAKDGEIATTVGTDVTYGFWVRKIHKGDTADFSKAGKIIFTP